MKTIYKLVKSNFIGDVNIGINLLCKESFDYILRFFEEFGRQSDEGVFNINVIRKDNPYEELLYIDLGDYYLIHFSTDLRLKPKTLKINEHIPITTKENFINGLC